MIQTATPAPGPIPYVILKLSDAKALATAAGLAIPDDLIPVIARLETETGGDMGDIALRLKRLPICHACEVEGQQEYCMCLDAQKLGRRLQRLIDRAAIAKAEGN